MHLLINSLQFLIFSFPLLTMQSVCSAHTEHTWTSPWAWMALICPPFPGTGRSWWWPVSPRKKTTFSASSCCKPAVALSEESLLPGSCVLSYSVWIPFASPIAAVKCHTGEVVWITFWWRVGLRKLGWGDWQDWLQHLFMTSLLAVALSPAMSLSWSSSVLRSQLIFLS